MLGTHDRINSLGSVDVYFGTHQLQRANFILEKAPNTCSSPHMSSCNYTRGPPLNTDISGIGVRISFYLQTLFLGTRASLVGFYWRLISRLGFLSARSGSIHEIAGALYTLMSTNAAMGVTGLILGLKPVPEISLQEYVR